jgi:MinD-like ATPase involved in chromosome partitioning or flagellar assembly
MLVACWSVKGGSGTTVITAALGLALASHAPGALLVDLGGDLPAALGVAEPDGPGLAEWLSAGPEVPADALGRLEVEVGPGLALLPAGGPVPHAPLRAEELAALLGADSRVVVADCGSAPCETALALAAGAGLSLLVLRPCYLALRRALGAPLEASAVVLVGEPQRALQQADVEDVLGLQVKAAVPWRPAVATAVDAGLLGRRLPALLDRALRPLVDLVAAS